MYHTFTGSSRRPRQVDLSGRKANPFATAGSSQSGPQQALQNAQHDRLQRQRQREELAATKLLQRQWRGYQTRERLQQERRQDWDHKYAVPEAHSSHSVEGALAEVTLLLSFFRYTKDGDIARLLSCGSRLSNAVNSPPRRNPGPWPMLYLRLERCCLMALERLTHSAEASPSMLQGLIEFLIHAVRNAAPHDASASHDLFRTLSTILELDVPSRSQLLTLVCELLETPREASYEGFVAGLLARPQSPEVLQRIASSVHIESLIHASSVAVTRSLDIRPSIWLLGQFLALLSARAATHVPGAVSVIGRLLAIVADVLDVEATPVDMTNKDYDQHILSSTPSKTPPNIFLKQNLLPLINQTTIRRVLTGFSDTDESASRELATYVLTLLRVFYNHADDIRMWMYLGPPDRAADQQELSPITFFWREAQRSSVVQSITRDPRAAVSLIVNRPVGSSWQAPTKANQARVVGDEWKVILIFLELYTFVLKLMDDEEFLGQTAQNSRSRSNPLSLRELAELVTFLKHLGFSMYYHAPQISGETSQQQDLLSKQSLSRHFGASGSHHSVQAAEESTSGPVNVAGLPGVSLDYVKSIVTGLVRSIYERDSRRKFLPKDHWLLTSEFDMSNFITDVVSEEESRQQVQAMDEEDGGPESDGDDEEYGSNVTRNMNSNIRRMMDVERKQRALRKASRRRHLESVAPRLEILQNMPFLIPFDTRVHIFREFVRLDQHKRRHGFVDPDIWRQSIMMNQSVRGAGERELNRHHARIRRKHEFQDAMQQFYELGPALKEPIQITFVDEFDIVEAGIDGGGVTKEFLTNVTSQAFNPNFQLFQSNSQHLLYPNPTAIDELKDRYDQPGDGGSLEEYRAALKQLLDEYEFAGRIIGKCLYEGILVDISFAGFFLVKWALANSSGLSSQESGGYRANINDLRDLDEELYQGLISLKNYQGDVDDLALTFSINDEIPTPGGRLKTIERELIPNGATTPVTSENRLVYISRIARYRLQAQSASQTNAFLKGLASIVQPSWLSMFNQSEIQNLVGGAASSIDIDDLRRNTIYSGLYVQGDDVEEHPVIQLFWKAMRELSDEDKGKVLKFVTSTPRAPLLGFSSLNPKFSIRDSGTDEARFPTTSTCINLLKLPRYKTKEALKEKLLYAINSGAGFDLS